MEIQMVQCEDGRHRQARIYGIAKEEGGFRIWKAGVRLKGKHVSGEAWYSRQTKTWYFLSDPQSRHAHLMQQIGDTIRKEKIGKLHDRLKQLESRHTIEQKKMAASRRVLEEIEGEVGAVKDTIARLEKGAPLESGGLQESAGSLKRKTGLKKASSAQ
jgi:hypothetical protein